MATVEKTQSFKQLTALRDAESINDSTLNSKRYSDLDLFFTKKSSNKDVNALTNITAIKRSVRNLILTNFYEKPFQCSTSPLMNMIDFHKLIYHFSLNSKVLFF